VSNEKPTTKKKEKKKKEKVRGSNLPLSWSLSGRGASAGEKKGKRVASAHTHSIT
jgi:hypothetical protein